MVQKYSKVTIAVLVSILVLISVFFTDRWILPPKTIRDSIIGYSKITMRHNLVGYKFYTLHKREFSLEMDFIDEPDVTLNCTRLLNNIILVKSEHEDHSQKLISGANGACLYLILLLAATAVISLLLLGFYANLSENGFQNIVLSLALILFYLGYLLLIHN